MSRQESVLPQPQPGTLPEERVWQTCAKSKTLDPDLRTTVRLPHPDIANEKTYVVLGVHLVDTAVLPRAPGTQLTPFRFGFKRNDRPTGNFFVPYAFGVEFLPGEEEEMQIQLYCMEIMPQLRSGRGRRSQSSTQATVGPDRTVLSPEQLGAGRSLTREESLFFVREFLNRSWGGESFFDTCNQVPYNEALELGRWDEGLPGGAKEGEEGEEGEEEEEVLLQRLHVWSRERPFGQDPAIPEREDYMVEAYKEYAPKGLKSSNPRWGGARNDSSEAWQQIVPKLLQFAKPLAAFAFLKPGSDYSSLNLDEFTDVTQLDTFIDPDEVDDDLVAMLPQHLAKLLEVRTQPQLFGGSTAKPAPGKSAKPAKPAAAAKSSAAASSSASSAAAAASSKRKAEGSGGKGAGGGKGKMRGGGQEPAQQHAPGAQQHAPGALGAQEEDRVLFERLERKYKDDMRDLGKYASLLEAKLTQVATKHNESFSYVLEQRPFKLDRPPFIKEKSPAGKALERRRPPLYPFAEPP